MITESELTAAHVKHLQERLARKQQALRYLQQEVSHLQLQIHDLKRKSEAREAGHETQ